MSHDMDEPIDQQLEGEPAQAGESAETTLSTCVATLQRRDWLRWLRRTFQAESLETRLIM